MLLSIIVPIYNVERYLPKCLDSLLNHYLSEPIDVSHVGMAD